MEGATKLVHGVLPYGHMPPGIIHGDTYPILSYAAVHAAGAGGAGQRVWDSVDGGLAVAALARSWPPGRCSGCRRRSHARAGTSRPAEVEEAGLRAALAWLAFPPLLITVSTGTTDVVLAAMLLVAYCCGAARRLHGNARGRRAGSSWRRLRSLPRVAGAAPGPTARRGDRRDRAGIAADDRAAGGARRNHGPQQMLHADLLPVHSRLRSSRSGARSGSTALQPLAQACVLGLIAAAVVKLRRRAARSPATGRAWRRWPPRS